jgi:nitrite reductase/ring-hydroxylating ferredoxin subunit/uncharacterized membrane protein
MSLKTILQGRPLGHPLHPITVHLPLGFWLFALIFDVAAVWNGEGRNGWMVEGAFWCLALGTGVAVVSAVTGLADWWDIRSDRPGATTALWHMGMMIPAVAIFTINTWLHYDYMHRDVTPVLGLVLSAIGYAFSMAGGYLGGHLVYSDGIAAGRHRVETELPKKTYREEMTASDLAGYRAIASEAAIEEGGSLRAEVDGTAIALIKTEGRVYAVQDFCTHRCGPLSEGCVSKGEVQCPWHNSRFNLATGKVTHGPANVDLKTFDVRVEGGMIHVRADRQGTGDDATQGMGERRNPAESEKAERDRKRDPATERMWNELP